MQNQLDPQVQQALGVLLQAALTVLAAVISYLAWRVKLLIDAKKDEAKTRIGADNFSFLEQAARIAVQFAEQSGLAGKIKNEGKDKFTVALATLQHMAEEKGIQVNLVVATALIEAAVRMGMHKRFDDAPATIKEPAINEPAADTLG